MLIFVRIQWCSRNWWHAGQNWPAVYNLCLIEIDNKTWLKMTYILLWTDKILLNKAASAWPIWFILLAYRSTIKKYKIKSSFYLVHVGNLQKPHCSNLVIRHNWICSLLICWLLMVTIYCFVIILFFPLTVVWTRFPKFHNDQ